MCYKKYLYFVLGVFYFTSFSLTLSSCGGDDDDDSHPTITQQVGVTYGVSEGGNTQLLFNGSQFVLSDYSGGSSSHWSEIACLGKVSGLSAIKVIPGEIDGLLGSIWNRSAPVEKGYGYVIRCHVVENYGTNDYGYIYTKIYVTDLVKDGSGGILAVKYQREEMELD